MSNCELCGEPLPPGEEMFKYHGYSCECPKPPLPKPPSDTVTIPRAQHEALLAEHHAIQRYLADDTSCNGGAEIMFEKVYEQARATGILEGLIEQLREWNLPGSAAHLVTNLEEALRALAQEIERLKEPRTELRRNQKLEERIRELEAERDALKDELSSLKNTYYGDNYYGD